MSKVKEKSVVVENQDELGWLRFFSFLSSISIVGCSWMGYIYAERYGVDHAIKIVCEFFQFLQSGFFCLLTSAAIFGSVILLIWVLNEIIFQIGKLLLKANRLLRGEGK